MAEYLIITGLSGAGRSTAAATFEDLRLVRHRQPAARTDRQGRRARRARPGRVRAGLLSSSAAAARSAIAELAPAIQSAAPDRGTGAGRCSSTPSDDVLVRRFEGTRRRHPVEAEGVLAAIHARAGDARCASATRPTS